MTSKILLPYTINVTSAENLLAYDLCMQEIRINHGRDSIFFTNLLLQIVIFFFITLSAISIRAGSLTNEVSRLYLHFLYEALHSVP